MYSKRSMAGEDMTEKPLRFAPLVRVSTEQQEKMGESLKTQKAQIEQAVKALGGVLIPSMKEEKSSRSRQRVRKAA